jgi:hypothetical protein
MDRGSQVFRLDARSHQKGSPMGIGFSAPKLGGTRLVLLGNFTGEEAALRPSNARAVTGLLNLPSTSSPTSWRCSDLGIIPQRRSNSSSNLMRVAGKGKAVKCLTLEDTGKDPDSLMRDRIGRIGKTLLSKELGDANAFSLRLDRQQRRRKWAIWSVEFTAFFPVPMRALART